MRQLIKYGFVGGLNFVFTFAIYWFFLKILQFNYPISFTFSWLSGVILTFYININWVFKPEEISELKTNFIKYFVIYLSSYFINLLLLKLGVDYFHFDPFFYQFVLIPIIVLINYTGIKYWALK